MHSPSVLQFTVDYEDKERKEKIASLLEEFGVVVIENAFSPEDCDRFVTETLSKLDMIHPNLSTKDVSSWVPENLMPQIRPGMFHRGYSSFSWEFRQSPILLELYKDAYEGVRKREISEFVTSMDGINIRPPVEPFYDPEGPDWAHIDQTERDDPFYCIQGQVVCSNTSAGFRCSPKSHSIFQHLLTKYERKGTPGNFFKLSDEQVEYAKGLVEQAGGEWQIPILVPRGSVILWLSSTIHSARLALPSGLESGDPSDVWRNWRAVCYICYRPKEDVDQAHLEGIQKAYHENLTTNHWGLPKLPPIRELDYSSEVQGFVNHPASIYEIVPRPDLSALGRSLLGLS